MMGWLWRFLFPPEPAAPDEPAEEDHFYNLEQAVQAALAWANREVASNPDNHHLTYARNHLSDAYICLWRASQWWQKYPQETG